MGDYKIKMFTVSKQQNFPDLSKKGLIREISELITNEGMLFYRNV